MEFRVFTKSSKHRVIAFMAASGSRKLASTTCSPGFKAICKFTGFPGGSNGKESACSVGDQSSIPGLGRSPGEGSGNSLLYSCRDIP